MIELGIDNYKGINSFNPTKQNNVGSKPCFVFIGDEFEKNENYQVLSNLLIDFFRGKSIRKVDLMSLDHVIICTAVEQTIYFRHYAVLLKKSGTHVPRIELEEIGPSFDMTVRRTRLASEDLKQESLTIPRTLTRKKKKGFTRTPTGTRGRVHTSSQDFDQIATKKMKGLKRKRENTGEDKRKKEKKTNSR